MKTYEYKMLKGAPWYVTNTLNETASEGWEVCGFAVDPSGDYHVLVRRPNG